MPKRKYTRMYPCKFLQFRLFLPVLIFVTTYASAQYRLPLVDKHVKINSATLGGELGNADLFGSAVCAIGDVNNDGITDLAAGTHRNDDGESNRGVLYIVLSDGNPRKAFAGGMPVLRTPVVNCGITESNNHLRTYEVNILST